MCLPETGNQSVNPRDDRIGVARPACPDDCLMIQPLSDGESFQLVGNVDLAATGALEAALATTMRGRGDVHLEVGTLTFIDAAGAGALVRHSTRLGAGRRLILHHPSYSLRRVMDLIWGELPSVKFKAS